MVKKIFDLHGVVGQPRGMTTEEKLSSLHSPESDCNSNNLDSTVTASYLSNTSSQDVDFIQDNSDYQWFLDYGYRETQHRSILSLSASYEEGCYDDLARDLDTQLAQVDMEDFRAEDILSTLPAMCCQDLQQSDRRGEMFASVSGSMMVKFDFDSSLSPQSSSQEEEGPSESMCKSGPLFSPVRESPLCHYSVDSLDCEEQDILLTCQANKDNYTIAFEDMAEESDCHDTGESNTSGTWSSEETRRSVPPGGTMVSSDARTTWCKVVTRRNHHNSCMRHSSASLPNLTPRLNQSTGPKAGGGGCVKLYDVQQSSSVSGSDSSFSSDRQHSRLSLVRLFIKQRGCAMAHSDYATTPRTHTGSTELCDNRPNKNLMTADRNQNQLSNWVTAARDQSLADSLIDEAVESESVERLSESVSVCSCEASLNMSRHLSGNNNNSLEREDIRSPITHLRRGTQTHTSLVSSSSSDPTDVTRVSSHVRNSATQCPLHCVDASMQTSLTIGGKQATGEKVLSQSKQPVYVMYPNYTLPDLDFLRDDRLSLDLDQVFLAPVKFSPGWSPLPSPVQAPAAPLNRRARPHSCADIDHLRKKGFSHIRDWESLAVLLPPEYCTLLSDIPELKEYKDLCTTAKPLFCVTPPLPKTNTTQFSPFPDSRTTVNNSSSSSTGTQPSSGYRGSSTLLSDSSANPSPGPHTAANPLFVYRYDSISSESGYSGPPLPKRSISLPEDKNVPPPPRPPLPRGILRNSLENAKLHKNQANKKRHSMFDMETANAEDPELVEMDKKMKTKSQGQLSGSDEGLGGEMWRPPTPPTTHALRLQQLLEMSGDQWDPRDMDVLRQQVSRFLSHGRKSVSFADGEDSSMTPPNSPQASVTHKPSYQVKTGPALNETIITEDMEVSFSQERLKQSAKTELVEVVASAASRVMSQACGSTEVVSSVTLSALCPALYSLLSDGLKPSLDTAFGEVNNSVWQVVEASAQQGPMTKALNELVLKLNSEDVLTEGVVKFNAFIFGLLNVQGLDVWLSYLRTRESVLRRHNSPDSLMLSACRGQTNARALSDRLLASLRPLAQLNFKLDLLYETRLLHQSLLQLSRLPSSPSHSACSGSSKGSWTLRRLMESPPPPPLTDGRPRSCVDSVTGGSTDLAATARKRWSVNVGGKLTQAYDRLGDDTEEEYTDSLETGANRSSSGGEEGSEGNGKFRRLQMKWEMLSGRENTSQESSPNSSPVKSSTSNVSNTPKSRIPRPVTSPVRPTNHGPMVPPTTPRPPIKKPLTTTGQLRRPTVLPSRPRPLDGPVKARTSRVDAPVKTGPVARPSSLPYRAPRAPDNHRRAVSSSTVRQPTHQSTPPHKFVVTLSHRLPSDSGHLAYNEGEKLRLVLEVDDTWLLCCRGDAKGLVPRAGVIPYPARI